MEEEKKSSKDSKLLIIAWILIIGAVITLLPLDLADDKCFFGYTAVCPFSPISSLLIIFTAIYLFFLRKKQALSNKTI